MSEAPEWLRERVQDARRLLGVEDGWRVTVKQVSDPGYDRGCDGAAQVDFRYLNADLEFGFDVTDDERGARVTLHEVFHVAMAEMDYVLEFVWAEVAEERRGLLRQLYEDAVERMLQRVTRAMMRQIKPAPDELVETFKRR